MITTNLIVSVLVLTNGVAAGTQNLELRALCENRFVVCDYCKAYEKCLKAKDKYGYRLVAINPPKGECNCQFVPTKIEKYELVPFVDRRKGKGVRNEQ